MLAGIAVAGSLLAASVSSVAFVADAAAAPPPQRAHELVSPVDKSASDVAAGVGAGADGNSLVFMSFGTLPGTPTADFGTFYRATRGASGCPPTSPATASCAWRPGPGRTRRWLGAGRLRAAGPPHVTDREATLRSLVAAGEGLAIVPRLVAGGPGTATLELAAGPPPRRLGLVWSAERSDAATIDAFRRTLRSG